MARPNFYKTSLTKESIVHSPDQRNYTLCAGQGEKEDERGISDSDKSLCFDNYTSSADFSFKKKPLSVIITPSRNSEPKLGELNSVSKKTSLLKECGGFPRHKSNNGHRSPERCAFNFRSRRISMETEISDSSDEENNTSMATPAEYFSKKKRSKLHIKISPKVDGEIRKSQVTDPNNAAAGNVSMISESREMNLRFQPKLQTQLALGHSNLRTSLTQSKRALFKDKKLRIKRGGYVEQLKKVLDSNLSTSLFLCHDKKLGLVRPTYRGQISSVDQTYGINMLTVCSDDGSIFRVLFAYSGCAKEGDIIEAYFNNDPYNIQNVPTYLQSYKIVHNS